MPRTRDEIMRKSSLHTQCCMTSSYVYNKTIFGVLHDYIAGNGFLSHFDSCGCDYEVQSLENKIAWLKMELVNRREGS
jgi:hypothetical protein